MRKIALVLAVALTACTAPEAKPAASAESPVSGVPAPSASANPIGSAPNPTTEPHRWVQPADVVGKWQHAHEKNVDGLETFVSAAERLPVAHFRKAFDLSSDGSASVLCLAPNDAHSRRPGTWKLERDVLSIEVQCFGPKPEVTKYSIERAAKGELAMRPLP